MIRFPVFVCRLATRFGISSGSRNVRVARGQEECLSKRPLSDSRKERPGVLGVNVEFPVQSIDVGHADLPVIGVTTIDPYTVALIN